MSGALTSTRGPARQTPEPVGRGGVVLLYHRVTRVPFDPQWLAVTPDHFAEHLDLLSRVAHPMSLHEMTRRVAEGTSMDGGVVLTFDDGYADNLTEALPLLDGCKTVSAGCSAGAPFFGYSRRVGDGLRAWKSFPHPSCHRMSVLLIGRDRGDTKNGAPDGSHGCRQMCLAPLLDRFGVPATVFVASGYVGGDREYWWDELERLLFSPVALPPVLRLDMGTETLHVDLDETRRALPAEHALWNVTVSHDPTCRHRLYRTLFDTLRPMEHGQRDAVLTALAAWSGESRTTRDSHRPLTHDELSALNRHPLVEIGAHTVTHPVLSLMDARQQAQEIVQSKRELEETIGEPVSSFSYPFGTRRDYSEATVQAVRDAGFDRACSNFSGMVTPTVDRYQLPRVIVRDGDGDSLARQLTEMGIGV